MNDDIDATFSALGDPTRRQILEWLDGGESMTATEIALRLPITRQAVTKHLKELESARLATSSRHGRETHYIANESGLDIAERWLAGRSVFWAERLSRLNKEATGGASSNTDPR